MSATIPPVVRRPASIGIDATRDLLRHGQTTVTDHITSVLETIHDVDGALHAFVAVAGDAALGQAQEADRQIRRMGGAAFDHRPLLGVAVSVKDLIQTRDLPTVRGSRLPNRRPVADAPVVARLRAAGAIVVGKTATSEYGWSASTVGPLGPPTRNPWAPDRSPGGSSGGSAAAVSAGLCVASVGTDGAGSIRIPAAFSGVVGFKPSFGRIPYVPPCAERLAHVGPIARTVADTKTLMQVLTGADDGDPDSLAPPRDYPHGPGHLRVGWLEFPRTSPEVRRVSEQALTALTVQGHRVQHLDPPFADPYGPLVDLLAAAEACGTAPDDEQWCDPGRVAIVHYGRRLGGQDVMRAEEARLVLRAKLNMLMHHFDILAMATVPTEPFAADAIAPRWAADPTDLLWLAWSPATYPFNMSGQPAVSIPAGVTTDGLPVGVQLVGRLGADDLVLEVAGRVEAELGLAMTPPGHERTGGFT